MKPGYKIIIVGLLVYGGFKIKEHMDVSPYKEQANNFVFFLKHNKPFEAQELLSPKLQAVVSIERITAVVREHNLSDTNKIIWSAWSAGDGNYTLKGDFVFDGKRELPLQFSLSSPTENKIQIEGMSIDGSNLMSTKDRNSSFLK